VTSSQRSSVAGGPCTWNAYNAYQSIIRGGHTFLTIRTGPRKKVTKHGLNPALDPADPAEPGRHESPLAAASPIRAGVYFINADTIKPGAGGGGALALCPPSRLEVSRHQPGTKWRRNTLAVGAGSQHDGDRLFQGVGGSPSPSNSRRRAKAVVSEKRRKSRGAGYDYAGWLANFKPLRLGHFPMTGKPLCGCSAATPRWAMAGGRGRCEVFTCAYPMRPFDPACCIGWAAHASQGQHHG